MNTLFCETYQNAYNHFYNKIWSTCKSHQYSFRKTPIIQSSFCQEPLIVLYAWSHYFKFRLLHQQDPRTYKFVLVAQAAKLYTLISIHKPASYHHVAPYTSMVTLTLYVLTKINITSRKQLMVWKPLIVLKSTNHAWKQINFFIEISFKTLLFWFFHSNQ